MGTHQFRVLQLSFATTATTTPSLLLPNHNNKFSTNNTSIPGGPNWAWKNSGPTSTGRSRSNLDDELRNNSRNYDDNEFGYSGTGKQRVWWFGEDEDDDDDDWDVDDEENEFWVFKVFKAVGWMLPAIAVSYLLGTDSPNAFLMALAVPLGQTVLSLAMDKVWGTARSRPKHRPRTKARKKPFATRASSGIKTKESKEKEYKTGEVKGSYESWVASDAGSHKKSATANRVPKFGGWDELDRTSYKDPGRTTREMGDELPKQNKGKLSRTGRVRDTPLMLRLLIAAFPFLASWTRFLF